eukprot:Skav212890  [mRNA]  locus=scaffold4893:21546:22233:- [translate_table: standard]
MNTRRSASVVPEAMGDSCISPEGVLLAAKEGFRSKEDDDGGAAEQAQENHREPLGTAQIQNNALRNQIGPWPLDSEDVKIEFLGDINLLSEEQKGSLLQLKETQKYNTMKLKLVNLSFSGASVFFFTPYRNDGVPMPASVLKFDQKECHMSSNSWS